MENANIFTGYDSIFATKLRELMKKNKTTQKELSEAIGTTRQAISQYADGSVQPNVEKLYKITLFFGVSADYLLGLSEVESPDVTDKEIAKRLGLTDKAIKSLTRLKHNSDLLIQGITYTKEGNRYNMHDAKNPLPTINFLLEEVLLFRNISYYFDFRRFENKSPLGDEHIFFSKGGDRILISTLINKSYSKDLPMEKDDYGGSFPINELDNMFLIKINDMLKELKKVYINKEEGEINGNRNKD